MNFLGLVRHASKIFHCGMIFFNVEHEANAKLHLGLIGLSSGASKRYIIHRLGMRRLRLHALKFDVLDRFRCLLHTDIDQLHLGLLAALRFCHHAPWLEEHDGKLKHYRAERHSGGPLQHPFT